MRPLTLDDLLQFLKTANTAQTGSFGELVFAYAATPDLVGIIWVHRDGIDLRLDGMPIDVKTTTTGLDQPRPRGCAAVGWTSLPTARA
jgi:hypothetical protein